MSYSTWSFCNASLLPNFHLLKHSGLISFRLAISFLEQMTQWNDYSNLRFVTMKAIQKYLIEHHKKNMHVNTYNFPYYVFPMKELKWKIPADFTLTQGKRFASCMKEIARLPIPTLLGFSPGLYSLQNVTDINICFQVILRILYILLCVFTFDFPSISATFTTGSWVGPSLFWAFILVFNQLIASLMHFSTFSISAGSKWSYFSSWRKTFF